MEKSQNTVLDSVACMSEGCLCSMLCLRQVLQAAMEMTDLPDAI
jgi:hypothetical protein